MKAAPKILSPFERDVERFSSFILEHFSPAREWVDIGGYCRWYIAHGFIISFLGDDGEIVALTAVRPVEKPGMGAIPFLHTDQGNCVHYDLWIDTTETPLACVMMVSAIHARFGHKDWVTFFRRTEQKMHIYPLDRFIRLALRLKKRKKE